MMALTTSKRAYFGDCELQEWKAAGLPQATRAKGVIQTIERVTIERQLGKLTPTDFERVKQSVRTILEL
jgi:hypothetical protein